MHIRSLVWRELFERKNQLVTSFLAIVLGVGVIVAVRNIMYYSEKAVARELDALGANILILPKSASLNDYYSADMQEEELPEEYVSRLATSDLQGLDNLSPKLSIPFETGGKRFILTGILPKSEFQAKAAWQGAGIFSRPQGCGTVVTMPGQSGPPVRDTLVRKRVIETLGDSEALIGAELAAALGIKPGESIRVRDRSFTVTAVLPETGTVDDGRVFAHLHTVQKLAGKGSVVNAIEVVGCCNEISRGLIQKINRLLPDAKVVTIAQIVDTQIRTNGMMARLSLLFLGIIVVVGGASVANYMYANVYERRHEIGTLMALGAGSSVVLRMFLTKALWLGLSGGIAGYVLGTAIAWVLGPKVAGVVVLPMASLALWAVSVAVVVSIIASYLPARRAARLDPCSALREI